MRVDLRVEKPLKRRTSMNTMPGGGGRPKDRCENRGLEQFLCLRKGKKSRAPGPDVFVIEPCEAQLAPCN